LNRTIAARWRAVCATDCAREVLARTGSAPWTAGGYDLEDG
jgi:hypothetical protein